MKTTINPVVPCRKAWRREAMDLLLDPTFFQMDHETLRSTLNHKFSELFKNRHI